MSPRLVHRREPEEPAGELCGVWQRRLLAGPGGRLDTRSLVIYLQTPTMAADLRISADRPAAAAASLEGYDETMLRGLLGQEGFVAAFSRASARVRWDRFIDYAPVPGMIDESWMELSGDPSTPGGNCSIARSPGGAGPADQRRGSRPVPCRSAKAKPWRRIRLPWRTASAGAPRSGGSSNPPSAPPPRPAAG